MEKDQILQSLIYTFGQQFIMDNATGKDLKRRIGNENNSHVPNMVLPFHKAQL
ncbi:MAG: hypothetical protein ACOC3C_03670 [Candidatus Thorarchaeota archaeon]